MRLLMLQRSPWFELPIAIRNAQRPGDISLACGPITTDIDDGRGLMRMHEIVAQQAVFSNGNSDAGTTRRALGQPRTRQRSFDPKAAGRRDTRRR